MEKLVDEELELMRELIEESVIYLGDSEIRKPISLLFPKSPICVDPITSLKETINLMINYSIGSVLIVKEERLEGIFTERDVLIKIAGQKLDLSELKVSDFMTKNPKNLSLSDPIALALRLMSLRGYRHIPILDESCCPVGIVSVKDIVDYIVSHFPQEILNLPSRRQTISTREREGA